ncbi:MAG: flagellar hook protein FlgE [Shinella sp.]|nr:flagellar hook protein FlgE [Shinella sp.]
MSLYGTMRTGVSGMNAQANRLGTVADNIANANTTGYKRADTQFSSFILPGTGGAYNSGGVNTNVRYSISQQGTFTPTTSSTDLAIDGGGFFIVQGSDGVEYLTRAGAFQKMSDGTLRNAAGYTLMGYPYSSSQDPTIVINGFDGLSPINMSGGGQVVTPSSSGYLQVDLPNTTADGETLSTSLVAYDSQGASRKLDFHYTKTGDNLWEVTVTYTPPGSTTPVNMLAAPVEMEFNTSGQLIAPNPAQLVTEQEAFGGAVLAPLTIDLSGSTQVGVTALGADGSINGSGPSEVIDYQVSSDGIVSLKYANGDLIPKFRIALANVQSPDMLSPLPGNVYSQSNDSGVIVMGYPGNSGLGGIVSNVLEDSNVDIATELTGMIEAQRNYTANSKVFQTGSELMDVLVNLKR